MLSTRRFAIIVYGSVLSLALAGALAGAIGLDRLAVVLLCLAVGGTVAVAFVSVRAVAVARDTERRALRQGVADLHQEVVALGSAVRELTDRADRDRHGGASLDELLRTVSAVRANLDSHRREARVQGERLPSEILDLTRAADALVQGRARLPGLGGWALSTSTMMAVLDEVRGPGAARSVVECGSGASTVWLAMAVREAGAGHVWSLEHDERYAAETMRHLDAHGLSGYATVVHAPIETFVLAGASRTWYDPTALARLPEGIDLLLVDGPPASVAEDVRLPAFPLLAGRLRDGSTVVLDDTVRADEQGVRAYWQEGVFDGRSLTYEFEVGRSTVFTVRLLDPAPEGSSLPPSA